MKTTTKTLLALSIAAASMQSMALPLSLSYDINSGPYASDGGTFFDMTFTGTATTTPGSDAINLAGINDMTGLTSNANITVSGNGVSGIKIAEGIIDPTQQSVFNNSVSSNGTINATGDNVFGLNISNSSIGGELGVFGDITVSGANSTALHLDSLYTSSEIRIDSDLTATGNDSVGFRFSDTGFNPSAVYGDIVNNGNISASGLNAAGVTLDSVELTNNSFINNGTVSASGTNSVGLAAGNMDWNSLVNVGTISATGDNSTAVVLDDSEFNIYDGLVNSGTIQGGTIAIDVKTPVSGGVHALSITNSGLIDGGETAIKGGGIVHLNWSSGTVRGNLLELAEVNIEGDTTFEGDTIQAAYVDLSTGKLSLRGTNTAIDGTLELADGSVLELFLGNSTSTTDPVVAVSGNLEVTGNASVALQAQSDDFTTERGGNTYTLIKANSITGGDGLTVTSSTALLTVNSYTVDGTTVQAVVTGKTDAAISESVIAGGGSSNAVNAVLPFDNEVMGELSESDPVFQAFANASTDQELAALAEELTPDVNGGATQAALNTQTLITGALNDRNNATRGLSSGDALQETGIWAKALSNNANQDERHGIDGYDADSTGIAIGADGKLNAETTVGVAYSYITTDVKSDNGNKTDVDTHALTAYGSYELNNYFVDAALTYGLGQNDSKRYVAGTEAKGDYDSDLVAVDVLAGYTYNLNKSLILEPRVGARYANVSFDSYSEKGSSAALNVGSQRYELGEIGAGVRLAASYPLGEGQFKPEATVMGWHDTIADKTAANSSFVIGSSTFATTGTTPARDSVELGLGGEYSVGAVTVGANYTYTTKDEFDSNTFTLNGRYDF